MRISLLVPLLVLSASGCSSDLKYCDIRSSSCRESIYMAVLDARGDPWDADSASPPSEVISLDELRRRLEAAAGSSSGENAWDPALTVLDLLDPSKSSTQASVDDQVASIAAYYSSATGRITVVDRGNAGDVKNNTFVLAHELVHAVQDRDHGLAAVQGNATSTDMAFARTSLVEGEAVLYSNLVVLEIENVGPHHVDWSTYYDEMRTTMDTQVEGASSRLATALQSYVYPLGGRHVTDAYLAHGNLGVRDLWRHPPNDTLDLTTPAGEAIPRSEPMQCPSPATPPNASLVGDEQLGPIGLVAMAETRWLSGDDTWALVPSWRADQIWGFAAPAGATGTVAIYRVRLADETSAQALETAIGTYTPRHAWRVERYGQEVNLAASDDPTLLDTWTGWRCQPPP